jgi:hypothetical protein
MKDAILIVGGYGAVGTVIASQLAQHHGNQLIIAGRNEARAAELAGKLGPGVRWKVLDVATSIDHDEVLAGVRWVIMCLDLPQIEFVRQCFQRGIHYVDISAEYPILAAISTLDEIARQHAATAVLSVGLVPGLSNLMARYSLRFVKPIERFDIALLAGLGEKHGSGGSAWTARHMSDAVGSIRVQFLEPYHQKTAYRFAFSDQYTLPQTLPIGEAATWLSFDSFLMTHLIGLARLPILRNVFRKRSVQQIVVNMTQRWQFGTDDIVLTTRARGRSGSVQAWLRGNRETRLTGLVAAEVVRRMIRQPPPAGVFHIEQLFELEEFLPLLERHGVRFFISNE